MSRRYPSSTTAGCELAAPWGDCLFNQKEIKCCIRCSKATKRTSEDHEGNLHRCDSISCSTLPQMRVDYNAAGGRGDQAAGRREAGGTVAGYVLPPARGEGPVSHARGDHDPCGGRRFYGSARSRSCPRCAVQRAARIDDAGSTVRSVSGLRPFEADEDHLFFGRGGGSDWLFRRLRVTRFLSMVGTYGRRQVFPGPDQLIPALSSGSIVTAGTDWRVQ